MCKDAMVNVYNGQTKKVEAHTLEECKSMEAQGILPKGYVSMVTCNNFFEEEGDEVIMGCNLLNLSK